jgi:hypothetical protein
MKQTAKYEEAVTPIAKLLYDKKYKILEIEIIDQAEMTFESTALHYSIIKDLTQGSKYMALVNSAKYFKIDSDVWKFASTKDVLGNRVAVAHYNISVANKFSMDFYKMLYPPEVKIGIFNTREEAIYWLMRLPV